MAVAAVRLMPIPVSWVTKGWDTWDQDSESCRPALWDEATVPRSRDQDRVGGPAAVFPPRLGRAAATPRLLDLDGRGELTPAHVLLVAQALGKSERTVWRWLAAARENHRLARVESSRFTVTTDVRRWLVVWGGHASRIHAEPGPQAARAAPGQQGSPHGETMLRGLLLEGLLIVYESPQDVQSTAVEDGGFSHEAVGACSRSSVNVLCR